MFERSHWRSQADRDALLARASLNRQIREFFYQRGVMEVETPALSRFANPDPHIHSLAVESPQAGEPTPYFLHTSPEFAMKRLLACGAGPIYQLCKVFRGHEYGRQHNPEFSLLEWYRPHYSLDQLMDEVEQLVQRVVPETLAACEKISYADLFEQHFSINPHLASVQQLRALAEHIGLTVQGMDGADVSSWLDLLFSHVLQPALGKGRCSFVFDFPVSQCALAKINQTPRQGAARFELFLDGVELANGYQELTDAEEMRRRFEHDLSLRHQMKTAQYPYDEWVLSALESGIPESCGVALGVDRLLMLKLKATHIKNVISFSHQRC